MCCMQTIQEPVTAVRCVAVGARKAGGMSTISSSQRGIASHLLIVGTPCQNMDPGMECEFEINTRSPPPLLSLFQKRPPETKQRVAQRRLRLGCMLHFLPHSGQMEGFPVAGICSSQHVRDRTNSSMARGLFKSKDRYFPPFPPPLVRAPRLLPTGALRLDCIKKDHFKEMRPSLAPK